MEFKTKTLANGLTIIGEVNNAAKSAAVGFFVKTGARDETKNINGVSHFLEHMLFKGTDKLSAFEVNEAFDRTGAQFNAFTSEESTVYYAAIVPEYLLEITDLWSQLLRPSLRDSDFDIEKNVIKEEIAMYQDMPSFDVMDRCRSLHFQNHPCGNSVLGTNESIDNLTSEQMRDYFNSRYAPNNLVVCCAGDFSWENLCETVEKGCSDWQSQQVGRQLSHHPGSKKKERITKNNLVCEHICMISQSVPAQDNKRFASSILAAIIGDDHGSRYFWELIDNAIAEAASMQYSGMDGTGALYSYIRCPITNVTKVINIVSEIFNDLLKNGVKEQELEKAKNKILSSLVIKNELPMGRLIDLGFNWMYLKQYRKIEEDVQNIKAVNVEQVNELINEIKPNEFTQFSIGPAD